MNTIGTGDQDLRGKKAANSDKGSGTSIGIHAPGREGDNPLRTQWRARQKARQDLEVGANEKVRVVRSASIVKRQLGEGWRLNLQSHVLHANVRSARRRLVFSVR
jgi:hypothetical protein